MRVLDGGYNNYKYEVYENSKNNGIINITLIIRSEFTLNTELDIVLSKIKNKILEYYKGYIETETIELSISKHQGIARYNIILKELKNGYTS